MFLDWISETDPFHVSVLGKFENKSAKPDHFDTSLLALKSPVLPAECDIEAAASAAAVWPGVAAALVAAAVWIGDLCHDEEG